MAVFRQPQGLVTSRFRLQRKLARARKGSNRRGKVKRSIAKLKAHEADARKDWCEKTSTGLARRFDVIYVEDLKIADMSRSARGRPSARCPTSSAARSTSS